MNYWKLWLFAETISTALQHIFSTINITLIPLHPHQIRWCFGLDNFNLSSVCNSIGVVELVFPPPCSSIFKNLLHASVTSNNCCFLNWGRYLFLIIKKKTYRSFPKFPPDIRLRPSALYISFPFATIECRERCRYLAYAFLYLSEIVRHTLHLTFVLYSKQFEDPSRLNTVAT